jgi:hypothetical protein
MMIPQKKLTELARFSFATESIFETAFKLSSTSHIKEILIECASQRATSAFEIADFLRKQQIKVQIDKRTSGKLKRILMIIKATFQKQTDEFVIRQCVGTDVDLIEIYESIQGKNLPDELENMIRTHKNRILKSHELLIGCLGGTYQSGSVA